MNDVIELEVERRAPPAETLRFGHTSRRLQRARIAALMTGVLFLVALVAGAPLGTLAVLFAFAAAGVAWLITTQRRVSARPERIDVSATGLELVTAGRANTFAWGDIAAVDHQPVRGRILISVHDGGAFPLDADIDELGEFLDAVTLHLDASRRSDLATALDRVQRPGTYQRTPWGEAAALATSALGIILGLLAKPALFLITALGVPTLVWRWFTEPNRVVVDESAVWIVRRFTRDVIPLRAVRDCAFGMHGRPLAPSVIIDHHERGLIVLSGFGADALPLYDAILAALRAQHAARYGRTAATRAGSRAPAQRSAAFTAGVLAAALAAAVWITVLTGVPLRTAVRSGNTTVLQIALLLGSPRNAADSDGLTALHHAAMNDEAGMVRRLARAGADPEARSRPNAYTPLHKAAEHDNAAAVRALLEAGADVHARSLRGRTPLAHALIGSATPAVEIATELLHAGSDPDAADNDGRTALHHAAMNGHTAWIDVLARAGADVEARDGDGRAPLHHAARSHHAAAVAALLEAGADIDARGWTGRTAIAEAAHDATTPAPVTDLLLSSRARVDIADHSGWNAVQLAAAINNAPALELFARRRVHVDATDGSIPPALHVAIRRHNVEAVRALLRGGASPSRPFNGQSAYDVANATRNPTITALVRMR